MADDNDAAQHNANIVEDLFGDGSLSSRERLQGILDGLLQSFRLMSVGSPDARLSHTGYSRLPDYEPERRAGNSLAHLAGTATSHDHLRLK